MTPALKTRHGKVFQGDCLAVLKEMEPGSVHCCVTCTVLDPFAGSGTTLYVAVKNGRRGLGIELNPDYLELIRRRLRKAEMQRGF